MLLFSQCMAYNSRQDIFQHISDVVLFLDLLMCDVKKETLNSLKWYFSISSTELFVGVSGTVAYTSFFVFFLLNPRLSALLKETGRKEEVRTVCVWVHRPDMSSIRHCRDLVRTQAEVTGDHLNSDTIRKKKNLKKNKKRDTKGGCGRCTCPPVQNEYTSQVCVRADKRGLFA